MTANDVMVTLIWLALPLTCGWTVWKLARPSYGTPASAAPMDASKVVDLRARRDARRAAEAQREQELEQRYGLPPDRAFGFRGRVARGAALPTNSNLRSHA